MCCILEGAVEHFDGKSQSFTSLANVRSLKILRSGRGHWPRESFNSCKSYGGGFDSHRALSLKARTITKKTSSSSSLPNAWRHSFLSQRPLVCLQRSSSISPFCLLD
ncbi:hypothetical protein Cni_G17347 [Canna indica]|uniref:Uncharacterized protein n=1 Tax=Canna indica TaxID=4628 RepID=A0AAQ3QF08_9LILI|nr:hypothetical protein Cni_G17347 [Canna indica]